MSRPMTHATQTLRLACQLPGWVLVGSWHLAFGVALAVGELFSKCSDTSRGNKNSGKPHHNLSLPHGRFFPSKAPVVPTDQLVLRKCGFGRLRAMHLTQPSGGAKLKFRPGLVVVGV